MVIPCDKDIEILIITNVNGIINYCLYAGWRAHTKKIIVIRSLVHERLLVHKYIESGMLELIMNKG